MLLGIFHVEERRTVLRTGVAQQPVERWITDQSFTLRQATAGLAREEQALGLGIAFDDLPQGSMVLRDLVPEGCKLFRRQEVPLDDVLEGLEEVVGSQ